MDNVKKFYEALAKDEAMQKRAKALNEHKPADEAAVRDTLIAFAAKEGYAFTADEAQAYIAESAKGELNDEQLEAVAGGKMVTCACALGGGSVNCGCVAMGSGNGNIGGDVCFCVVGGGGYYDDRT